MNPRGMHLLLDFNDVDPALLADAAHLEAVLREAAQAAGIEVRFVRFEPAGEHGGVIGILLQGDSRLGIHTWPDSGYAAIDLFMTGGQTPEFAVEVLVDRLDPCAIRQQVVKRGPRHPPDEAAAEDDNG
ncbi:S-adenosylmethionine decarboxylase [Fluviicoccus keumensis]|uniref:S-adenosylmethionine decarboxylase n=1 Tax=Fluviicoccus keumensis TaxID=1435465 RepID=A0A4Q7ZD75_9GAMM|nr:adenosylmethionine decarboxylase [Fluviicoccus keumensis]RZU47849.1 S-adenosylmethionine decarboxylase [Fluviicoccus keumensis]